MDYKFLRSQKLAHFQSFINSVYGVPDDRLFSLHDLVSNEERFAMRAIKGIRKGDRKKLEYNLLVSFSWLMAIANRLRIDIETAVWKRFPFLCSYCGKRPCLCKKIKPIKRVKIARRRSLKPKNLAGFQEMFSIIYPPQRRTLADAGIHMAEEVGEVSETIHVFLGEHKWKQFEAIGNELADYISCIFGVANSAGINVAAGLEKMYGKNCHICHHTPCTCAFSFVAKFKS